MEKIKNFMSNHLDFKVYGVTIIAILTGLAIIPAAILMPIEWGAENGVIENMQMAVLFLCVAICLTAKNNKDFFRFCALALFIIIIREVNCGRTLFFPVPGQYHIYYSWRDLEWKWLGKVAHTIYALFIAFVSFLFIKDKQYLTVLNYIRKIKLPVWNFLIAGFAMFMGAIAEKFTNNDLVFEEGFELLFYVSVMGIFWLYSRNKNFSTEENQEA